MLNSEESFLAGFLLPKVHESVLSPQEKREWKNDFPIHHGAVGVVACVIGILTKSPRLTAFGIGLALDDWKDRNQWFSNIRF